MNTPHFSKIEDVFAHLEYEGYKYQRNENIADLFIPFQNIDGLENISCFEIIVFKHLYITDDNKVIESSILTDTDGNKHPNIDINNLTENFFIRLKERLAESNHPFLKAYYSHLLLLLSNATESRRYYIETAVNSYLELIEIYKSDLSIENIDTKIYHATRNACMIAIETNYNKQQTINTIIENTTFLYQRNFVFLKALVTYLVEDFKNFKTKLITFNLQEICFNSAHRLLEIKPIVEIFDKTIAFFYLGKKIDQKFSTSTYNWLLEIAKVYEKMSIERQDLANSVFCLQALNIYSSLKMEDKIQETAERYKQLIASRQLFETHQVIDVSSQIETFNTMKAELLAKDIKEILQLLSSSDNTMVSISEINSLASNQENDSNNFLSQLSKSVLDNNGHTAQEFEGGSEKYEKLKFYGILLDTYYNLFVVHCFNELVKNKVLTFDILINFLEQNTWFGQEITKRANGFSYEYKWTDFIKPALENYFVEIDKAFENKGYQPSFILFIDSLASKMEGIVRDIFELNGEITFQTKGQVKNKTVEKDLNDLFKELEEGKVSNLIKTNDWTFLKFLLTDRGVGFNLRNDIAHTLMRYEDYNIKVANLLLLALLRLSHYQPTNQSENGTA
ncbi:DUF4209 domain-containing protein [Hugenholtzia roseola]|uniref:DUF4209 domain-containing protein n=1 Tax=Hugenholtzia roseola TaxID=1002 RepID=UPI00054EA9FD|nr:DUF4209 domain-containing protein [Hugenholtzia roseola]